MSHLFTIFKMEQDPLQKNNFATEIAFGEKLKRRGQKRKIFSFPTLNLFLQRNSVLYTFLGSALIFTIIAISIKKFKPTLLADTTWCGVALLQFRIHFNPIKLFLQQVL